MCLAECFGSGEIVVTMVATRQVGDRCSELVGLSESLESWRNSQSSLVSLSLELSLLEDLGRSSSGPAVLRIP